MTEKLYDKNAYLFEFEANVISCSASGEKFEVILDCTAFFPQEGGQDCDTGVIDGAHVTYVSEKNGEIIHIADRAVCGKVLCRIDRSLRFDRMQQHTGEHIVCGIVHKKYGYENVGFHLGNQDVTFDFDGPLSPAQLDEIEALANRAVQANLPVRGYYPDAKELSKTEYRSKKEIDADVRIVEIENIDRCACCAPHVSRTGEVGLIKFTDSAAYKGGIRIHMSCGMRALNDYREKQKNLEEIAKALSCKTNNAADFFAKYADDTQLLKQKLSELKKELIALRTETVEKTDGNIILFENQTTKSTDSNALRLTVNALEGKYGGVCAVFAGNDKDGYGFAAASDKINMNELAQKLRRELSARCGGNEKMIQGNIFSDKQSIERLFENI